MFSKILIANRGEIACRVIKTAQRMGVATVAVYSDADQHALHVQMADEAVYIGPSPSTQSYLNIPAIIKAALDCAAEAIHPGYGFLSENAEFCRQCAANNLVFIGPPADAILAMGSKSAAKTIMDAAGIPLISGYHGKDQDPEVLKKAATTMGYPVLLKAAAGGGGKGMRAVYSEAEFDAALEAAKREAQSSFNDEVMLVEKYLQKPRHIEMQIFCDSHNNAVHLFERDCSVQRRHQKVIEEAPAPGISDALREKMGETAINAARAINYQGAGTVEFLLDSQGDFFFMEMNTRLQVEHPVTEMISGQDLVEWQLRIAAGEPLPCSQDQLSINGHAFEARIYAEDPEHDFLPATGKLSKLQAPSENTHVRVDTGVVENDEVSVYYDPMIAKLIVWDSDRKKALGRLTQALREYRIGGLTNNIGFLYNLATCQAFCEADVDTGFIEQHNEEILRRRQTDIDYAAPLAAAALQQLQRDRALDIAKRSDDANSPWHLANHWGLPEPTFNLQIQNNQITIEPDKQTDLNDCDVVTADVGFNLFAPRGFFHCCELEPDLGLNDDDASSNSLNAPMNGTVVGLLVDCGATVSKGAQLLVMEAMKMEHTIVAPSDGVVSEFYYQPGDLVDGGSKLLAFEASK